MIIPTLQMNETKVKKGYVALWPWGSDGAGLPPQFCLAPKPMLFPVFQRCPDFWISWSRSISKQTAGMVMGGIYIDQFCHLWTFQNPQ